jgi:hypothetical protein
VSIFGSILDKIFHHSSEAKAQPGPAQPGTAQPGQAGQASQANQASQAGAAPAPQGSQSGAPATAGGAAAGGGQRLQNIDVEAVLEKMAAQKGGGGNWRTSIVDLLKLLGLDSSLSARKELAKELDVHAGADGSAEQNIALQKAVMQQLAQNGGKVPDSLRH